MLSVRAVVIHETGGPEVLRLEEVSDPEPGDGEVLVRLEATGVNRFDVNQRARGATSFPLILGRDAAGVRVDTGERVLVTDARATYAEVTAVREDFVWAIPDSLPAAVAAAIGVPYRAAWRGAVEEGGLARGATLVVQGGASSTGQACIDIGRALGASVSATSSPSKRARVEELGARWLAYDDPELDQIGADVVFEPLGARTFARSVAALGRGGRLVTPGAVGDPQVSLDVWTLVGARGRIIGFSASPPDRVTVQRLIGMVSRGDLHPYVERELPLEQAAEAHRLIESGDVVGRVVLRP